MSEGDKILRWQNKKDGIVQSDISPSLRASGGTDIRKQPVIQLNTSKESNGVQPYQQNRVYDTDGIVPALPAQMSCGTHAVQIKSATKEGFEEANEGDSINLSNPNSKTRRGRVGVAQTLDTQANQSVLLQGNIRQLTEIECEKLQGFSPNWTYYGLYPFKKISQPSFNKLPNEEKVKLFQDGLLNRKKIAKGNRYKLCGNAVTVDIVELIARKMDKEQEVVLISLFSGIDGFAEGLIRAGFKISHHYFSEIDLHAIANLKYNFPHAEYIGSVTDVSGSVIRQKHPGAKIIVTFGWPCQDNSIAGKCKGQRKGTRSGLLFEAGRIINELRPQHFIAENVKGIFSVNEGYDFYETIEFLTYLNSDSPQYTVEMQLLNTSWLLPQNRERTYFVGHLGTTGVKRVFPITENDFGATEGSGDAATVRAITGGAQRRHAQHYDITACVNDINGLRDCEIVNCIDKNYHKGPDNHGQRTLIRNK